MHGPSWKPILIKDWSQATVAKANWRNYGALAYKQKDLNDFYVDELIAAQREKQTPKDERGRIKDPSAKILIQSGESVIDHDGATGMAKVDPLYISKKKRPIRIIDPPVMDFGYRLNSNIDWEDCI